ncbi:hypothetical protein NY547_13890 [Cnuibacter physcomitrellae]|uniref:hypothetical protein n=1 Tax=Cnuibacter physcomitrellae TaxID=1619308 RepID=UPI002175E126|nr:hypothetical protein [Cnuibacter physcomitrellae]MCS5498338.1 hypothetical protein [Cnuibacter physcomitrellae]
MRVGSARWVTAGLGALALTASLSACSASPDPDPRPSSAPSDPSGSATAPSVAPSAAASGYRDGRYTATGWYGSLPSHQDVTLALSDGVVTDVTITTPAEDQTSLGYQQRFAEALPAAVVGQRIDELDIDRLAGSSGCSEGFVNALDQITQQASS